MEQVSMKYIESFKERRLLKAEDIASILNISLGFAYQLMKRGDIPTVSLGRSVRVRPLDLEGFIHSRIFKSEIPQYISNHNNNKMEE